MEIKYSQTILMKLKVMLLLVYGRFFLKSLKKKTTVNHLFYGQNKSILLSKIINETNKNVNDYTKYNYFIVVYLFRK